MRWLVMAVVAWAAPPMSEPAISPDRKEIAFVSGGDIWTVPSQGGQARLLITHAAYESRPLYSPDGSRLAFQSNRSGATCIYIHEFASGLTRRLTFLDSSHSLDNWSRDGEWIYFSSAHGEVSSVTDIYRVRVSGGTPMPVSADRFLAEFHGAPTPDGKRLLFVARGAALAQWWRKGRSHLDESEIWMLDEAAAQKDTRLLPRGAKQLWPQWAPDGNSFFFVSDRNGPQNIHQYTMGKGEKQISRFRDGRVLFPSLSADGKQIVFERDFQIWSMDLPGATPAPVKIALRGAPADASGPEWRRAFEGFTRLALSPDGKKISFSYWGDLWAAPAADGGEAYRVTNSLALDSEAIWSPDSNFLAFTSTAEGESSISVHDFVKNETRLRHKGRRPDWSPDGKRLAYTVVDDLYVDSVSLNVKSRSFAWSPDGQWIAAIVSDERGFRNVHVIKADGSAHHQVSWLPNTSANNVQWFPDGRSLLFETNQRTEPAKLAVVDLTPKDPEYREQKFRDLFAKPAATAKPATTVDPNGLRERLRFLSLDHAFSETLLSRDGKQIAFTSGPNLYIAPVAGGPPKMLSAGGPKNGLQWDPAGKTVFFQQAGRFYSVNVDNPLPRPVAVSVALESNFDETRRAVFDQAWDVIRERFYDPAFHGVDWNGAVKRTYGEAAGAARTPDELRRLLNLMVGELDASHLGARGAAQPTATVGYLGIDWNVDAVEKEGKWRVGAVLPNGPAALAGLQPGDVVTHLNGVELRADSALERILHQQIGRELAIRRAAKPDVKLKPIALSAEITLRYNQWVQQRKAYVSKWSGGRLGYVHIADMSSASLEKLQYDLDAENQAKDGVVVDIRNNRGGFVNGYALDIFARRNYINMQSRGQPLSTGRATLGQRAYGKPTVLLINQHTLSDGEDFTEGYRALGLGKVVGEATAGWIIYTSDVNLLDGTVFRIPGTKVTTMSGENMERNPRKPDIAVDRQVGESYRDSDVQLETAVKTLLSQLAK